MCEKQDQFPKLVPTSWWLRDIKDPDEYLKGLKWLAGLAVKIKKGQTEIPGISVSKKGKSWVWMIWGPEAVVAKRPRTKIERTLNDE